MNTLLATPVKPVVVINFANVLPLFERLQETSLALSRAGSANLQLISAAPSPLVALERRQPKPASRKLADMPLQTVTIPRGQANVFRAAGTVEVGPAAAAANLDLPFGMPRFVNAATLKRMLKAKSSELLLKRTGDRWSVCDDSTWIDLTDAAVEFRLGEVQIFS